MPKSVKGVMDEFKAGKLHSGSSTGKKVTNPKQAVAIALNEQKDMVRGSADHKKLMWALKRRGQC